MRILDKKNMIKIESEDLNDAKLSSMDFVDENVKKRAFVDVLGARLGMKFLFSKKIEANNLYSLYSIHKVLEKLDIADVYFENIKIDVRLVFNPDEIFVPKKQSELDILPDVYLVLALQEDLSAAECLGFFEPKNIDQEKSNADFYFFDSENLKNPDELKNFLTNFNAQPKSVSTQDELEKAEGFIWSMVDDEISKEDSVFLLTQLALNFSLREKFVELENFELLSNKVAKDENLMKDHVLDFVGAQEIHENPDFDESTIEEINFESVGEPEAELDDLDDVIEIVELDDSELHPEELTPDEPENNSGGDSGSGIGKTLVEGAAIAGGIALAGGAIAAGAGASGAAMAQGVAAASGAALAEGLASAGTTVLENITESVGNSVESPSFEEIAEAEKAEEAQEVKEDSKEEIFAFDALEEPVFEELEPLEELPELEEISDEIIEEQEAPIELEKEIEQKSDDVVDLADFDFDMFDSDDTKETASAQESQESEEESNNDNKDEYALSFDEISDKPALSPAIEQTELSEADDSEIENHLAQNSDELGELTSQVDELLKGIDLSDEQKNALTGEFADKIEDHIKSEPETQLTEEIPQISLSQLSAPETPYDNPPAREIVYEKSSLDEDDNDLLKVLYNKEEVPTEELPMEAIETGDSAPKPVDKKKKLLAASVAGVILVSLIAYGVTNKPKTAEFPKDLKGTEAPAAAPNMPDAGMPATEPNAGTPGGELNLDLADQAPQAGTAQHYTQPQAGRDMGQAVSEAFMSDPVSASVSKVAWEVPEEYAYNDRFRQYLQTAGKNLKLTLQNDLLLSTEMAYSDKIVVDLDINKDGSIKDANVVTSSGSKQIDKIVLQSVKETMKYLKAPASELSGQSVKATLIINF